MRTTFDIERRVRAIFSGRGTANRKKIRSTLFKLRIWLGDLSFLKGVEFLEAMETDYSAPGQVAVSRSLLENWMHGEPVFLHELGHQYFRNLALKHSDKLRKMVLGYDRYISAIAHSRLLLLEAQKKTSAKQEEWNRISEALLYAHDEELKHRDNGFGKMTAYDELFADLFACLALNDPEAVAKVLDGEMEKRGRSFLTNISAQDWNPVGVTGFERKPIPHLHLSPSREELWRAVAVLLGQKSPVEILESTFKAMISDFEKNGFEAPSEDIGKANQSLLEEIRATIVKGRTFCDKEWQQTPGKVPIEGSESTSTQI